MATNDIVFHLHEANNMLTLSPEETGDKIYAFTLYNSDKQLSDLTFSAEFKDHWIKTQTSVGGGKYNLGFEYAPGGTRAVKTGTTNEITVAYAASFFEFDQSIDHIDDTSHIIGSVANPEFSEPYDTAELGTSYTTGSMGDPIIYPLDNPLKEEIILPRTNKVYRYLNFASSGERLIINTQTWILDFDRIVFAEELIRDRNKKYFPKKDESLIPLAVANITRFPKDRASLLDSSFCKHLYLHYGKETSAGYKSCSFWIDLESEKGVERIGKNIKSFNFQILRSGTELLDKIKLGETKRNLRPMYTTKRLKALPRENSFVQKIVFSTSEAGKITLSIFREFDKLNHRNSILLSCDNKRKLIEHSEGALVSASKIDELDHLGAIKPGEQKRIKCETLPQYLDKHQRSLRKRRLEIRAMVRANDYSLLSKE